MAANLKFDSRPMVDKLAEAINRGRFYHLFVGDSYHMSFFHEAAAKSFLPCYAKGVIKIKWIGK